MATEGNDTPKVKAAVAAAEAGDRQLFEALWKTMTVGERMLTEAYARVAAIIKASQR